MSEAGIILPRYVEKREEIKPPWQVCGELMAEHFLLQSAPTLLLDMDGVVLQSDSLYEPRLISPDIIPALIALENRGIKIGPATARNNHVLDYLRSFGLCFLGPAILEEGQVCIANNDVYFLAKQEHHRFLAQAKKRLEQHLSYRNTWDEVKNESEHSEGFVFCQGNYQWQGDFRSSFWFHYKEGPSLGQEKDREIVAQIFEPELRRIAEECCLDYDRDIAVRVNRMSVGGLVILRITALKNGKTIDKGMAAEYFLQNQDPWIFVADGFGDVTLAEVTQRMNGKVVAIEGNLDISSEVPEFIGRADTRLKDPADFILALQYSAYLLSDY